MISGLKWAAVAVLILGVAAVVVVVPNFAHVTDCFNPKALTIQNLHAIQLAVERYQLDHGEFPKDMEPVQSEGYLPKYPSNAYRQADLARSMREVDLEAYDFLGDFSYVPRIRNGKAVAYELIAYGLREDEQFPLQTDTAQNHIILKLHRQLSEEELSMTRK